MQLKLTERNTQEVKPRPGAAEFLIVRVPPEHTVAAHFREGVQEDIHTTGHNSVGEDPMGENSESGSGLGLSDEVVLNVLVEVCGFSSHSFSSHALSKVGTVTGLHVSPIDRVLRIL